MKGGTDILMHYIPAEALSLLETCHGRDGTLSWVVAATEGDIQSYCALDIVIACSVNPRKRLYDIVSKRPLKPFVAIRTKEAYKLKRAIHQFLESKSTPRRRGDGKTLWFRTTIEEVITIFALSGAYHSVKFGEKIEVAFEGVKTIL